MEILECAICGLSLSDGYVHKLECGHEFHYECLLKSFKSKTSNYSYYKKNNNNCPYCRSSNNILPIINGLKKIEVGIHIKVNDFYKNKGLGTVYNNKLINLQNVPCKAILKKGKRAGETCGKCCKLGSYYCGSHRNYDMLKIDNISKLGDKQEKIEIEIAQDISKKLNPSL